MTAYYVNNNDTANPNYDHEVHTEEHANQLRIKSKTFLGYYESCHGAVRKAKEYYSDADGCKICCNECHIE